MNGSIMYKDIAIIVQARTGSTRLPGKMLIPFYGEECILEILLKRILKVVPKNFPIIVATTNKQQDHPIADIAQKCGIDCFQGNEQDVLLRFIGAAKKFKVKKIIRICADNLFIDTKALMHLINNFSNDIDYISYQTSEQCPSILTHYGFWAEGVRLTSLEEVNRTEANPIYHEHVTNYIYRNPDKFKLKFLSIPNYLDERKNLRLTLDTQEDFKQLRQLYAWLIDKNMDIDPENIVAALDNDLKDLYHQMAQEIEKNKK